MILEREGLEVGVKFGAQFQQRLQPDPDENVITGEIGQTPKKLKDYERETEPWDQIGRVAEMRVRISRQNIVDDDLERPGLEQIESDAAKREKKTDQRLPEKWAVVTKRAAINRHWNLRLADARFQIEVTRDSNGSG